MQPSVPLQRSPVETKTLTNLIEKANWFTLGFIFGTALQLTVAYWVYRVTGKKPTTEETNDVSD